MIPPEKGAAVTRGMREAFGVTTFEDIRMLTTGLSSALVYRLIVGGSSYLLRVITRTDSMNDPTRQFTCMKAAAEAGLAPRVRYTSIEDRICITDFVEAVPFRRTEALIRIPRVLRMLHALPPFPKLLNDFSGDQYVRKFQAAEILPDSETEEILARHAQLSSIQPRRDADRVSSHNDLKPENILFDGHRVWLADWEAAFLNDRYFDLAVVANFVVSDAAEESIYLREYFEQPPDEYQSARFFLMRQEVHLFYAVVFLLLGSAGKPVDLKEKTPDFRTFHQCIWAGEVSLADNDMKTVYGRVHWEQLSQNIRQSRFDEALRIVADRHQRR